MKDLNKNKTPLHEEPIFIRDEADGEQVEIALQWNDGYSDNLYTFTNTIKNADGGTHTVGFKGALTRTVNKYVTETGVLEKLKLSLEGDDIREGLTAIISVKIRDPKFSSQTKDKLVSSHVKAWVEQVVNEKLAEFFEENPKEAKRITEKIIDAARGARPHARPRSHAPQRRARFRVTPRQARRLLRARSRQVRDLLRRRRLGRRLGQAGTRSPLSRPSSR